MNSFLIAKESICFLQNLLFRTLCLIIPIIKQGDSENGTPELVSLLQYMKNTRIDNPEMIVHDQRIEKLDSIVNEVKRICEKMDHLPRRVLVCQSKLAVNPQLNLVGDFL